MTGSRALNRALIERKQPLYRRLGSRGFAVHAPSSACADHRYPVRLTNFSSASVALQLFRRQKIDGYMFDVEILGMAKIFGHRIKEVPIRWRDDGDSRLQLMGGNQERGRYFSDRISAPVSPWRRK